MGPWYEAMPDGLDTGLASGGSRFILSGEAQLLAFARVFLTNPGLVIMDEASSTIGSSDRAADGEGRFQVSE